MMIPRIAARLFVAVASLGGVAALAVPASAAPAAAAGSCFFKTFDHVSTGQPTTCDNGATTSYWYHGTDLVSGQTGWVPDCYLNGEPS